MQFLKRQWKKKTLNWGKQRPFHLHDAITQSALTHCLFKMLLKALIFSYLPGPLDSVTSKSMSCLVSVASVAMVTAHLGCGERRRKWAWGCCYHLCCRGGKRSECELLIKGKVRRGIWEIRKWPLNICLAFLPQALSSKSSALLTLAEWLSVIGSSGAW